MENISTFLQSQTNDPKEVCEFEDDDVINGLKVRRNTAPKRKNIKKINY